jgi:hypothetical protein
MTETRQLAGQTVVVIGGTSGIEAGDGASRARRGRRRDPDRP